MDHQHPLPLPLPLLLKGMDEAVVELEQAKKRKMRMDELAKRKRIRKTGMEYWKPALPPKFSIWNPKEPEVESQVSFWKASSESSQGSIRLPSFDPKVSHFYWTPASPKPSPMISLGWKPPSSSLPKPESGSEEEGSGSSTSSTCVWKWTPSPESEQGGGLWNWKPPSPSLADHPKPPQGPVFHLSSCHLYTPVSGQELIRRNRRSLADFFRKDYKFVQGKKRLISPGLTYHWTDECYATSWLAVHGTDSICMVTKLQDLDMTRVGPLYQSRYTNQQTLRKLAEAVISEVECLPYDRKDLFEKYVRSKKPFALVSLILSSRHKDKPAAVAAAGVVERKAVEYLEEKIKSGSVFTYDETIQTAISAFQHVCSGKKFKPLDIWVTVLNIRRGGYRHLSLKQIKEHLRVIRGVSRGCCTSISSGVSEPGGGCSTSGPKTVNIMEAFGKIALTYKGRPCPCGSKECGGNGLNPCEAGGFKGLKVGGFKPYGDNAAACT